MPTMCARYGIDEAVVTRFWGTGQRVALDAMLSWSEDILNPPDTGSLRTDLHGLAAGVARQVNNELGRSLMRAMVVDGRAAFTDTTTRMEFWKQRFAAVRSVMDRAAERGELRDGVDILGAMQLVPPAQRTGALHPRADRRRYCQTIAELAWHAIKA